MPATKSISVTLPARLAEMVAAKVASGQYASESDVVEEGLRALEDRDAPVEDWLRNEVVPTLERVQHGVETLIPAEDVFANVEARYNERKRARS